MLINKLLKNIILITLFQLLLITWSIAACKKPFLPSFSERTVNSIKVNWKDNNNGALGFQLAFGKKGTTVSSSTISPLQINKFYTIEALESGTSYSIWLRTICAESDTSQWEGPFNFTTVLTNPSRCNLNLDIKDDNCKASIIDEFYIEVNLPDNINHSLQSVSIIASHTWPADLEIYLENPSGLRINLSKSNGNNLDNYGLVNETCIAPATFSNEACTGIKDAFPPFIGDFRPEENLSSLNNGSFNGLWKLLICDGALNDKGNLKFVELKFTTVPCKAVENFYMTNVTSTGCEVIWAKPDNCLNMELEIREKGSNLFINSTFVSCDSLKKTVGGLSPQKTYEIRLTSKCLQTIESSPSCIKEFTTACQSSFQLFENFDNENVCTPICREPCILNGWLQNKTENEVVNLNWIVNEGETNTEFTGPKEGVFGGGKYIYLESNPQLCGSNKKAILESRCLKSISNSVDCDLSFYYHMFGNDIGTLQIQKSSDNGKSWQNVFEKTGNQNNQWQQAYSNLQNNKNTFFKLRFIASSSDGIEGDIALDQITLTNALIDENHKFFLDNDGDGFGQTDSFIISCDNIPPFGFAIKSGDCNDAFFNVNPDNAEIPCNLIDENCDGNIMLSDLNNPIKLDSTLIKNQTCKGFNDGSITLFVSGGVKPYNFEWSNGGLQSKIENISAGFYKCTIRDQNGCGLETQNIEIKSISVLNIVIESITKSSCNGVSDGSININHSNNQPPYNYLWSNGSSQKSLANIKDGFYNLTVTDNIGCRSELINIEVGSLSKLNVVTSFLKNPLCFGDSTGIIEVEAIGGKAPYTYVWEDSGINQKRREKLNNGLYKVNVIDSRNCMNLVEIEIKEPDELQIILANIDEVRCFGSGSGKIRTKVTGGTQPYDFIWQDGYTLQNRNNITAGLYSIAVSDKNGCEDMIENIKISEPPSIKYELIQLTPASCLFKPDGKIELNISGGMPPYQYFSGEKNIISSVIDSLIPGSYALTVIDNNNCKLTTETFDIISLNTSFDSKIEVLEMNTCPNEKKAALKGSTENNFFPLDFNWSNGRNKVVNNNEDFNFDLPSGKYNLTITDASGCVSITPIIEIPLITPYSFTYDILDNVCNSDSAGKITVTFTGGNPPYLFEWNNKLKGHKIDSLPNGQYSFVAKDKNNCIFSSPPIELSSTSDISLKISTQGTFLNENTGKILIQPEGGQGLYSIDWEDGFEGFNLENLASGSYGFTVSDEFECKKDSFAIVDVISLSNEAEKPHFKAFPNPFMDLITIRGDLSSVLNISLFDIYGKVIKSYIPMNKSLDLSHLIPGIYFLKFETESRKQYIRLIKI